MYNIALLDNRNKEVKKSEEIKSTITVDEVPEYIQEKANTIIEEPDTTDEIKADESKNECGTLDNMEYIVDITEIVENTDENTLELMGNTSTEKGYSGIIQIKEKESGLFSNITVGNTYVITTTPMITMSIPPQVTAIEVKEALESDIETLENIRKEVSNYAECMLDYEEMTLEEIINNANINYATWTQEEIKEYIDFIKKKGYNEEYTVKSVVHNRDISDVED